MPIDRITYIGLKPSGSDVVVMRAGKIKYRAIESNYSKQLIDGTNVHQKNWLHLEFTITAGGMGQQVLRAEDSDLNTALIDYDSTQMAASEQDLTDLLEAVRSGTVVFYPRLVDQFGAYNYSKYTVVPDQATIDLIDARANGRFPLYSSLKFKTKTALTSYPSWIDR